MEGVAQAPTGSWEQSQELTQACPGKPRLPNTAIAFPHAEHGLFFFLSSEERVFTPVNLNAENGTVGRQLYSWFVSLPACENLMKTSVSKSNNTRRLKLHNHLNWNWRHQIRNVFGHSPKPNPNKKANVLPQPSRLRLFKRLNQQQQNVWLAIGIRGKILIRTSMKEALM